MFSSSSVSPPSAGVAAAETKVPAAEMVAPVGLTARDYPKLAFLFE